MTVAEHPPIKSATALTAAARLRLRFMGWEILWFGFGVGAERIPKVGYR